MLNLLMDHTEHIYLAIGATDFRKQVEGLVAIVNKSFAKANDLNTYEYLKYLLTNVPNLDIHNHPEKLERYLPWSKVATRV